MPHPSLRSLLVSLFALTACTVSGCAMEQEDLEDEGDSEGEVSSSEALSMPSFKEPTEKEKAAALANHAGLDPSKLVPRDLLAAAVAFVDVNASKIKNREIVTIVDFSAHSSKRRFFVANLRTGKVKAHVVAHGSGSDPGGTGYTKQLSNTNNSHMSSRGYYLTGERFNWAKHGPGDSLRLIGLSSTNSAAMARGILMHSATYVSDGRAKQGTSWGCFAVSVAEKEEILEAIDGGSVIYAEKSDPAKAASIGGGGGNDDDEEATAPPTTNPPTTPDPGIDSQDEEDATACKAGGVSGVCIATAACKAKGGTSTRHLCPGANDIQCCTKR